MVDDVVTANLKTSSRKRKHTPAKNGSKSSGTMVGNSGNSSNSCSVAESMVVQKGRKLKQYVLEEKLDIIDYAKIIGNRAAGREFNVAESSIREWRKNEQRLRSMFETAPERSRLDGGGRRPVSEDLEKGLLQYVTSRSEGETALTWHDIKEKANDLWKDICERNPEYNNRGFTANMGWVARFVRRNNITLQVTNSASTITPKLANCSNSSSSSSSSSSNSSNSGNSSISSSSSSSSRSSSRGISTAADDLMPRQDTVSADYISAKIMLKSDSTPSTLSAVSNSTVTNLIKYQSDAATTNDPVIATTTTVTNLTTETTTAPTTAIATILSTTTTTPTTVTTTTTSTKKRRKNFIPKKVVSNDVICLTTNSITISNENTIASTTTTIAK